MYNTLEKAVFALKSHRPQVDKRPKAAYEVGVMFDVVMFRSEFEIGKSLLQHASMVLYFCLQVLEGFFCKCGRKHYLNYIFQIHQYSPCHISFRNYITNNQREESY